MVGSVATKLLYDRGPSGRRVTHPLVRTADHAGPCYVAAVSSQTPILVLLLRVVCHATMHAAALYGAGTAGKPAPTAVILSVISTTIRMPISAPAIVTIVIVLCILHFTAGLHDGE